ncbi:MAG: GGDEF domain-containing protein [Burkholderiales bacterium]|nr:GGDEF domain-containing protein [Burkholderiales bacterium]
MGMSSLHAAFLLVTPLLLAVAAVFSAPWMAALPPELTGLQRLAPYLSLLFAIGIALAFQRGRIVLAATALLAAYWGYRFASGLGADTLAARTTLLAISILLPLNLGGLALLRERGLFSRFGLRRALTLLLQIAIVLVVIGFDMERIVAPVSIDPAWAVRGPLATIPLAGRAAFGLALAVALVATFRRGTAIEAGIAGAIATVALACHQAAVPLAFPTFFSFAALMLATGVLQDAYWLAYRDHLTGLGSRRALDERLLMLSGRFVIAMIDVDRFKQFNDRWGHAVGDQVLRMVAAHVARAGGGCRAYRYGGEEFTLVFAGRSVDDVQPLLEALRAAIENYVLTIRAADLSASPAADPSATPPKVAVSVTVSIGVAAPDDRRQAPESVLDAADLALRRAKDKGRNTVSR